MTPQTGNAGSLAARVAIGTAQFGGVYGVANTAGQVCADEVQSILSVAREKGIRTIDTAVAYGGSETTLGNAGVMDFDVVTKVPAVPTGQRDVRGWIERQVEGSLTRLGVDQLDGVLTHRASDLRGSEAAEVQLGLEAVRVRGLVRKIGVSGYAPAELDELTERYPLNLVQLPLNVFDRRAINSGLLRKLAARNVEVHVRSVFLQGLLVMPAQHRPAYFTRWTPMFDKWSAWTQLHGLTPIEAALRFIFNIPDVSRIVMGFDLASQLLEALVAAEGSLPALPDEMQSDDEALIDPSQWKLP